MSKIDTIKIKGFRSFRDTTISIAKKSLIIGANDVGKTNLIYALRLLFDKRISESDLELFDSDYCIYSDDSVIVIEVQLSDVKEECLLSVFKGMIRDGKLMIRFLKEKDKPYEIYCGFDPEDMIQFNSRFYIRHLFMECVDTNRDLDKFIKKERLRLLANAKLVREEEQYLEDQEIEKSLQEKLLNINNSIENLSYIQKALDVVNEEMKELSVHNSKSSLSFTVPETDMSKVLSNVSLSFKENGKEVGTGGDGKNNQIFLATWVSKQYLNENNDEYVCFYAIEEPESHLHPQQQRKLSSYIVDKFNSQVLLTSHSPFIGTNFIPSDIVKLKKDNGLTIAASGGASKLISEGFDRFNYRLNLITSDLFFVNGLFLVEGPSEKILYQAICDELGIDLDYFNVSIISTDGIGFAPYISMCQLLDIPFVLRTDNDIFNKKRKGENYQFCAGINRLYNLFDSKVIFDEVLRLKYSKTDWEWEVESKDSPKAIPSEKKNKINKITTDMEKIGLFLAQTDLETDLVTQLSEVSELKEDKEKLIKKLKEKKATNMYQFVKSKQNLSQLEFSELFKPIKLLLDIIN
ncbi:MULTISPECIES: ATP-dependent nuclease [Lactococcus]|uniref:ATP-dependent nuclease n=1 Tax=Lactococcus TaxID=1357 RepID=UPI002434A60E|nr:AAA family ATPase [Lactococcus formosensis]MDG6172265.1 AAA family ATPase [Lactococcus formosensis]